MLVQHTLLNHARCAAERNGICEIEIAPGLDQSEVHVGRRWIGNDSLNLRHGEIASRVGHLARFIVDDPIANAGLNPAKIIDWETDNARLDCLRRSSLRPRIPCATSNPKIRLLAKSTACAERTPSGRRQDRNAGPIPRRVCCRDRFTWERTQIGLAPDRPTALSVSGLGEMCSLVSSRVSVPRCG